MNFTWTELLTALFGSGGTIVVLFALIKLIYERLDLRRGSKQTANEKAYEAVWKLYEAAQTRIKELENELEKSKQGNSLSQPTITKVYQSVRRLGRQIEVIDTVFIREFIGEDECSDETKELAQTVQQEMEILRQRFDELEKSLPGANLNDGNTQTNPLIQAP